MKKLRTRPPRFVALDNRAVDDLRLSVLDVGLLAVALRCPDGADFTVESLARKRKPGRDALTGAMRNLVTCGYIVKLKVQDAASGTWRTEFSVADLPFTHDDVADMLAEVDGARAVRVEPAWLDPRDENAAPHPAAPAHRKVPRARSTRPTGSRKSVATSTNAKNPQVAPTDGFPTVGEPAVGEPKVGNPSAKRRRLQEQDSLSSDRGHRGSPVPAQNQHPDERETTPRQTYAGPAARAASALPGADGDGAARSSSAGPEPSASEPAEGVPGGLEVAARVADAWARARTQRGIPVPVLGKTRVAEAAAKLAAAGAPEHLLVQAVTDMARHPTWLDLARHLERWSPPRPAAAAPPPGPVQNSYCGECEFGWTSDEAGRAKKCGCLTNRAVQR